MSDDKLILPVLKDMDWAHADKTVCRRLAEGLSSSYLPWLAFGYDHPHTFEFLTTDRFSNLNQAQFKLIEQAALRNLSQRSAIWEREKIKLGGWKKIPLLICANDFLAAERLLDPNFMQQAQDKLRTRRLLVGVPRRGILIVTNGLLSQEMIKIFTGLISTQYYRSETAPITPTCFLMEKGRIIGLMSGSEEVGKEIMAAEAEAQLDDQGVPDWKHGLSDDEPYIGNLIIGKREETEAEAAYLFVGGPNIEKLADQIERVFPKVVQAVTENENFGGQIYINVIIDITPNSPDMRERLSYLLAHLNGFALDLQDIASALTPLQVTIGYVSATDISGHLKNGPESINGPSFYGQGDYNLN